MICSPLIHCVNYSYCHQWQSPVYICTYTLKLRVSENILSIKVGTGWGSICISRSNGSFFSGPPRQTIGNQIIQFVFIKWQPWIQSKIQSVCQHHQTVCEYNLVLLVLETMGIQQKLGGGGQSPQNFAISKDRYLTNYQCISNIINNIISSF